ncbi:DNA helicase [Mucor ambiguus]|uniref:DNA replication ATP-dependent helicase/nuclease DNA2 n=1 Tax=Mucor ambiguus TaxID=91626 RepID=A0A0C9M1L1_9FUNG|nr:DNA helicase [Mucor ambiguus]
MLRSGFQQATSNSNIPESIPNASIHKRQKTDHVQEVIEAPLPASHQVNHDDDDDDMFGDDIALEELDLSTIVSNANKNAELTMGSDMFDDLDMDELNDLIQAVEARPSQPQPAPSPEPRAKRQKFIRYLVASMTNQTYSEDGTRYTEKVLVLIQEDENRAITAKLRQEWEQTRVVVGDVVHIPYTTNMKEIIIDNQKSFIVVHPDRLISCTAVADSYSCLRKSVLQLKVKGVSEYTEALVHGNIIHTVLQNALQTGDFAVSSIRRQMKNVIANSLEDLYAMDQDEETALSILMEYADHIHAFGTKYVNEYPRPDARVSKNMGMNPETEMKCTSVSICKVLDIEEHLWSPTFGLKGMVDASVQLRLSPTNKVLTVPFELKTGKVARFITNRAQTLLYTLLMSDRYDVEIGAGILYYSKVNSLYLIPAARNDLRSLIMARNYLAIACSSESLPPMLRNSHTCQYCYINDACTLYHKAVENGNGTTSGLYKLFDDKTDHMTEDTCRFFKHWWELLDQEETDIDYIRKDIWSQPAETRELSGRCLANMELNLAASIVDPQAEQWKYCFTRSPDQMEQRPLLCNLSAGDPVVVSSMQGHINLALGFVNSISTTDIVLDLNEPLRNPPQLASPAFDALNNQDFNSFVRHKTDVCSYYSLMNIQYRIDKDEMSSGMAMLRNNLVMLTAKSNDSTFSRSDRLRELIIDLKKPNYQAATPHIPPMPHMNPDQRKALKRVVQAEDYSLILGMPGTGKTTTTAEIINYLVQHNQTVLVAAYTHTALDNVLIKVREHGVDVLRLGNSDKVMPAMRDCMPSSNSNCATTVQEMRELYGSKKVVGVTCLGIGHVLLQKREFDYCIIDEASQITLPTCIGPLRYAKRFVLVGDVYQLPPIVRNREANEAGLDKSLFAILAEARPESISYLEYQYRMNRDIMDVSNTLIYDGKLKCGNHQVASRTLQLPLLDVGLEFMHKHSQCQSSNDCWLSSVLDPRRRVVFVNTDEMKCKESRPLGSFLQNEGEAQLIQQVVETLLMSGLDQDDLAVISVYRSQLRVISQLLKKRKSIEIATIDKYQGRDKNCVLISLVRNNKQGNAGDLLRDWRRLNVAITRAKSKLVLFGSASTLRASALYSRLLDSFEQKGWMCNLPENAPVLHRRPEHIRQDKDEYEPVLLTPKAKKPPKPFLPTNAILKKNDILQDFTIRPDQVDEKACWFRKYFVGKPYITLIGPVLEDESDLAVISIVKEVIKKSITQYRIIVRTKQDWNIGFIVKELDATELVLQLDSLGQLHKLDLELEPQTRRNRPKRSFSSAIITGMANQTFLPSNSSNQQQQLNTVLTTATRLMRAALMFLFQDINFKSFKEITAQVTIMAGLEKEFLRYDEIGIPKSYKFGVLTVGEGQQTEEEWFSNTGLSIGFDKFLNIIGKPVKLKGYQGYAAGLDTKTDESGEMTFASTWRDHEIIYHVAALMPLRQHDVQQVHRKRYIGNDIVCIVFMEGDATQRFTPESIRSQFLHVFIVVYYERINQQDAWRVQVLYNKNVKPFSPPVPSPPIFNDEDELREFLLLKREYLASQHIPYGLLNSIYIVINAENASLKSSEKFTLPNNKARQCILKSLIESGLEASQVARSFGGHHGTTCRLGSGNNTDKKHMSERPKSAGAVAASATSATSTTVIPVKLGTSAVEKPEQQKHQTSASNTPITPELPPVPSISRSSVLRELVSLTRRKSSNSHSGSNKNHVQTKFYSYHQQQHSTISEDSNEKQDNCLTDSTTSIVKTSKIASSSTHGIRHKAHAGLSGIFDKFF